MRYAVVLAGGSGTRLWPMSRTDLPKQLMPFIEGKSLLKLAFERLEGVRKALLEAHIPLPEEYVRHGGFSAEGGYRAALEILQLPTPPTAVLACNNRMTFGLMRALKDLGLKCPQDVSVLGFDEFDWYELFSPQLTTVVQPSYELGKQATEMLLQVIEAPDQHLEGTERNRVVLKAELHLRDSTAPPRTAVLRATRRSSPAKSPAAKLPRLHVVAPGMEKTTL